MVCQADSLADPATLKKMLKSVVQEEDRSRNVVIFGLPEQKDENVEKRVQEVFQEIGLKITLMATRVGKIGKDNAKRRYKFLYQVTALYTKCFGKSRNCTTQRLSAKFM